MKFALLVFYAAGTLAAPVLDERYPKENINIVECTATRFRPGTTFEYEYGGTQLHKVEGTTEKSTGLKLSAKVSITQLKGCNFHMKLSNVGLLSKSMDDQAFLPNAESLAFSESLQKNAIVFTMKGNTVSSVRPLAGETTEMLNIKRGIISTLQLDETATTETDVNGKCDMTITKGKDGLVVKTKSLSECSDRTQEEIGIQSSSIKTSSSLKPLDSKSTCKYTLASATIKNVVCEESHLFRPFSAGYEKSSGATTLVTQAMVFTGEKPAANIKFDLSTPAKAVLYDHVKEETKTADSMIPAIDDVMNRLVDQAHLSVKQTSAEEFTSLVRMFRTLDQKRMTLVWNRYFDCISSKVCGADASNVKDLYRQYMLDAIAYCGTSSCVSVVKEVTISGEVAGERANMFLQSISLLAKTTNSMIRDILDIAENKPSRQVFLTLGTLISRHCAKSPEECNSNTASVVQAENFLVTKLGDCSGQENHERVEEILLTLKAIGNAKRPVSAQSALITCARNSKHTNITMSAFDALRGMECAGSTVTELRDFISNENIDADKRIYAFQASMKCSVTKDNIEKLVHQYNLETNKQMASFMWTYFTNIMESSDPSNKMAKSWLHEITAETPLKETKLPMYQYSKHYEKSLYIDSLQTGATAKADVVFHPDGFLPSTAVFDMTAKVMGVPMDLVQTAVGIDGMETLLENVFGPDGAMPKNFVFNMFNWTVTAEKLKEMVSRDAKNRERRAIRKDEMPLVNDIHEAINMKPTQPSGFMSMKIMGQEVRIMSYDDIYAMIDQIDNMNVIQLLLNIAKGGKKTFSKSVMFLEMTHQVPTGLGLPLKLKLAGSTVGTVDLSGKFDIRNMFWGPGALSINGFVKPSAVVEVGGQMATEIKYISTGLRVTSNMMVSNELKGSIIYKEGNMLKINMDTPSEPVQLFKFSSSPFMFLNQHSKLIEGNARVIAKDGCLKSQLIGYGMCTSVRMPVAFRDYEAPYFPFTGPAHFGVSLVRGDEKLTTFQFLTTMTKQANGFGGVMEFSTPNAVYERKLSAKMLYTDINNDKVLTLSTERFGRTGALKFSYNSVSHRTSIETKNNFFTSKDIKTHFAIFNQTSLTKQQFGIRMSAAYDWYKFEHVTKYVRKESVYMLESHTEYAPKKSITAALEYNTLQKKVRALLDINQVRQAVELVGKLESTENEKGVSLMLVHVPTGKKATFYTGFKAEANKKEIMTSLNVMGKSMKNILGWYKNGDIQSIEDFFVVQGKTAKFGASWEDRNGEKGLQFTADIFGKKATSTVIYSSDDVMKTLDMSMRILGKEVSSTILLANKPDEKSFLVRLNSAAKPTEWSIAYYNKANLITLMLAGKALGNNAKLFWTLDTADQYRSSLGFGLNKYAGGIRVETATQMSCVTTHYSGGSEEKIATRTCVHYTNADTDKLMRRRIGYSTEVPALNLKLSLDNEMSKEVGHTNLIMRMLYNDALICTKTLDLVYKGLSDSQIKFDMNMGASRWGMKLFSLNEGKVTDIGFQLYAKDNTLLFLNKYDPSNSKITSSIRINSKTLPVTTEVTYAYDAISFKPSFKINVGDYGIGTGYDIRFGDNKFGVSATPLAITKGARPLFRVISLNDVQISGSKVILRQNAGFTYMNEFYVYGWTWSYDNQSNDVKRIHELTGKLQWSATSWSTVIFTLADSTNMASLNVDVEYIPTKSVHHFVTYNKNKQQLAASVEVLPKVYAKLMSTLENKIGYQLKTDVKLECKYCKTAFTMINSYVNDDKEFLISANLGTDLSIGLKINKVSPKTLTLFADAFGNKVDLVVAYENMGIEVRLNANGKNIFRLAGSYDQLSTTFRMLAAKGEKVVFDVTSGYNKFVKGFKLAFAGLTKWGGVYVSTKGERTILNVDILGKAFAKIIFNKKDMTLAIQSLRYPKLSLVFKFVPKSKTLSVSVKTTSNRFTINARADWVNKIAALHGFFNKEKVGVKMFFLKKSMIFKVLIAPQRTLKATFTKIGNTVKVTLQRLTKGKVVNEAVFKYVLSKKLSEVMFKWDADIVKMIKPLIENAATEVKELINKIKTHDWKLVEISNDAKAKILQLINKLDKAIDEFDFVPVRDFIVSSTSKVITKLSELTVKMLTTLATGLDKIKTNTPAVVQKLRELIKSAKATYIKLTENMELKKEVIVAKVKMLVKIVEKIIKEGKEMMVKGIKEGKELITKGNDMLKTLAQDIELRLVPIMEGVKKATKEITAATKPVVEKFIELAKDFKIRGMRLEDIVTKATVEGRRLLTSYIEKVKIILAKIEMEIKLKLKELKVRSTELLNKLKVETSAMLKDAEAYVMKLKIPYTDKTAAELIKTLEVEITKFVKWLKSLDAKKIVDETKTTINKLIKAKSAIVQKQIELLVSKYNTLRVYIPAKVREFVDKVVAIVKTYGKDVDALINQMSALVKPFNNHMIFVGRSINKHFGPLLEKIANAIELPNMKALIKLEMQLLSDIFLPLLKPVVPLYKNLVGQVRQLNVMGFRVGPLFDMQVNEITTQMDVLTTRINKEIATLRTAVKELSTKTPNEVMTTSIEASVKILSDIVKFLNTLYEEKAKVMVNAAYKKLQVHYKTVTSKSFDEITEAVLTFSSDSVTTTAGELSSLIKQLVAMDISGPTWKAIRDLDVIGRLEKFGVTEKLRKAVKFAKAANLTKLVMKTVTDIQELINLGVRRASIKAIQMYTRMEIVFKYLQSIPKKDYEAWLNELATFTLSTRDLVSMNLKNIHATLQKQAVKAYEILEEMKKIDTGKYTKMMYETMDVVKDASIVIAQKSKLVYDDIKQPTIDLYWTYINVVTVQLSALKTKFITEYLPKLEATFNKLTVKLETILNELKTKLVSKVYEIRMNAEMAYAGAMAKYEAFMAKYGDMTWEEIVGKLEQKITMYYSSVLEKCIALKADIEAKVLKTYEMAVSEYKKLAGSAVRIYSDLKTQITAKYDEIKATVMVYYEKCQKVCETYGTLVKTEMAKLAVQTNAIWNKVKGKATEIYNKNKGKTLKQIYTEIKSFITATYLKQKEILKAISEKNMDKAMKLLNDVHIKIIDEYRKVLVKVTTVIIPEVKTAIRNLDPKVQKVINELKYEAESITNQTLRNTVILAKEIIKAYTPLVKSMKTAAKQYMDVLELEVSMITAKLEELVKVSAEKMVQFYKTSMKVGEMKMKELIAKLKKLVKTSIKAAEKLYEVGIEKCKEVIQTIKSHDMFIEYVAILEEKFVLLKKLVKEQIEELKTNAIVIQIKGKIIELKEILKKEIERILKHPKFIEIKNKVTLKINELKELIRVSKQFVASRFGDLQRFVELNVNERKAFIEQKISEIKWFIGIQIDALKDFYEPKVQQAIKLLKQIEISAIFTGEKLRLYALPYFRDAMSTALGYAKAAPQLTGDALVYFAEAPEDAFWYGVEVWKEVVAGAYLRAKSVTSQEIKKTVLEFYKNVLALAADLYNKCTDDFTKKVATEIYFGTLVEFTRLQNKIEALPELAKMFYEKNLVILKDVLKGKFDTLKTLVTDRLKSLEDRVQAFYNVLPGMLGRQYTDAKALLMDTAALLEDYTNTVIERIRDNSLFKTIVDNQIWGEIIGEVKKHEFVVLATTATELLNAKIVELKDIVMDIIRTKGAMLKVKLAALKEKAEQMVTKLKGEALDLYRKGTEEFKLAITFVKDGYTMVTATAKKIFEETTIAEIVAFVEEQYKQVVAKVDKLKVKFLKDITACLEECKTILTKVDLKDLIKKAKEVVVKCKAMLKPLLDVVTPKLEKLSAYVVAKYEKLSAYIIAKYGKQFTEVIAKWKSLSASVIAKYKEVSTIIIAKYKVVLEILGQKYVKAMEMYNKYKTMTMEELKTIIKAGKEWAKWVESKIGAKVTILKKMTLKETIEALKKLPTLIEKYTTLKYSELKATLISEFKKVSAKCEEIYKIVVEKVQVGKQKLQQLIKELQAKAKEAITKLEPYLAEAQIMYGVVEREVYETAVFVCKYYKLREKYNMIKKFIIAEVERIIAATKKSLPMLSNTLKMTALNYAGQYKSLLDVYARDTEVFTKTAAGNVAKIALSLGDDLLRGVHSGIVLIDSIDREELMVKLRNIVQFIKDHVTIITKDGLLIARITHPDIKPTINYITNVVKTTARKTMKQLKVKGKEMLKKIETELPALKEKIRKLKAKIQEAVMESTFEIRRDLNISYKVNKNIAIRLYDVISRAVVDRYAHYNTLKAKVVAVMNKGKVISEAYWKQIMLLLQEAYGKTESIITDIASSPSPKVMYNKIITYITEAIDILKINLKPLVAPKLAALKTELSSYLMVMKGRYEMLRDTLVMTLKNQQITLQKVKKTALLVKDFIDANTERFGKFLKAAYDELKTGIDAKEALKTLKAIGGKWADFTTEELMKIVNYLKGINVWGMFCQENGELCKLIDEGLEVHKMLLKKYVDRVAGYLFVGKAHVDRAMRRIKTRQDKNVGEKYLATAMIMGNHILTFDNKFYDFVNFAKVKKGSRSPCSYLLARDFQDKKFTLSKLENAIVVETPDMIVKIRDDGMTRTTIGNAITFSLPVESGSSKCVRMDNLILCHFKDQRMKITVDLKNFFATISISGWYKGKSQGLLGTYNNEAHDDWRLPNNMITKNVNEFANSYELSGTAECQLSLETDNTKVCDGRTSKMCAAYFESKNSPFASVFDAADPKPFMTACSQDTKCKKGKKALCSIVAGYVALLRTRGVWVPQVNECMADKGRAVNEEWTQKSTKSIDVVVMMSQHKNMLRLKKSVAATMMNLHKLLKKGGFNVRYALVGFGGAGVHERAHSHPLRRGPSVFGYAPDLKREIKAMPFGGEGATTNDGYHAILRASRLKFKPAAEKVFIMFNSEPHNSHATGPSFDETKYILSREANAPLFVFDSVNFPKFGKEVGRVIGETARKLYTSNNEKGMANKDLELPASEFKQLVLLSKGGLFSNTIKRPQQTAVSIHDAVLNWVRSDMSVCKRCTLRASWTGQSKAICVSDRTAQC